MSPAWAGEPGANPSAIVGDCYDAAHDSLAARLRIRLFSTHDQSCPVGKAGMRARGDGGTRIAPCAWYAWFSC